MKVLFIGGTGNISRAVSSLAVARGIDLHMLNRGKRVALIPGATTIVGDVAAMRSDSRLLDHRWDAVVNWIAYTDEDVWRDIEVFAGRTGQYVFISSASAYQKPPAQPVITESTPLVNPYWEYSRKKIACEQRLMAEFSRTGFPVTIVRPSLTYDTVIPVPLGGWTEYTLVERIRRGQRIIVHGDGTSLWTVTHADDFAAGFLGLLGQREAIGEAFHITSDEILTWNQIYQALAGSVGCQANIVHIPSDFLGRFDEHLRAALLGDKAYSVIFDNSKIKRFVPGFSAAIPFRDGIKRTIDWFEADPERMVVKQSTHDLIERILACYDRAAGAPGLI
jgi:nucleoside-diphosphate-sugar epimerase